MYSNSVTNFEKYLCNIYGFFSIVVNGEKISFMIIYYPGYIHVSVLLIANLYNTALFLMRLFVTVIYT